MQVSKQKLQVVLERSFLFNALDKVEISNLADQIELVSFDPDQMIYHENSSADSIFVVYRGLVRLQHEKKFMLEPVGLSRKSDVFGLDIFSDTKQRIVSARSMENSVLIRIPRKIVLKLMEKSR